MERSVDRSAPEIFAPEKLFRRPAIAEALGGASGRKLDSLLADLPRFELGSTKYVAYRGSDLNELVARGLKRPGARAKPAGAAAARREAS